jgi:predicted RNA polymerase sigma factor
MAEEVLNFIAMMALAKCRRSALFSALGGCVFLNC